MKIKSCRQQEQEYKSKNIVKQTQKFQTSATKNQKLEMKKSKYKNKSCRQSAWHEPKTVPDLLHD